MTLATVRMTLLIMAVRNMPSRAFQTSTTFSHSCQSVGQVNSSWLASARPLAAVSRMKTNGTTKTTIDARIATTPAT